MAFIDGTDTTFIAEIALAFIEWASMAFTDGTFMTFADATSFADAGIVLVAFVLALIYGIFSRDEPPEERA